MLRTAAPIPGPGVAITKGFGADHDLTERVMDDDRCRRFVAVDIDRGFSTRQST